LGGEAVIKNWSRGTSIGQLVRNPKPDFS